MPRYRGDWLALRSNEMSEFSKVAGGNRVALSSDGRLRLSLDKVGEATPIRYDAQSRCTPPAALAPELREPTQRLLLPTKLRRGPV